MLHVPVPRLELTNTHIGLAVLPGALLPGYLPDKKR